MLMQQDCEDEIRAIHEFFQDWLNGSVPRKKNGLQRVAEALSDSFFIISPDGSEADKNTLLEGLFGAHGSWRGGQIWIENIRCRYAEDNLCLMVYEEWQGKKDDGEQKGRLSSALFKKEVDGKISWLHVHEVWLG